MDFMKDVMDYIVSNYGKVEEGDEHAVVLNDAVVVISMEEEGHLKITLIGGSPDRLNISTGIFGGDE